QSPNIGDRSESDRASDSSETPPGATPRSGDSPGDSPEPRARIPSIPVLDVMLDPPTTGGGPSSVRAPTRDGSPAKRAIYGAAIGLGLFGCTFAVLLRLRPPVHTMSPSDADVTTKTTVGAEEHPATTPSGSAATPTIPSPPPAPLPVVSY